MSEEKREQQDLDSFENILRLWTQTPTGRREFLKWAPLLMTACATGEKTRYREGNNEGQKALTLAEEQKMSQEALMEIVGDYPLHKDRALQDYMQGLGDRIVNRNRLAGKPYQYKFSVVDVPSVNAFALPAGTVFVTVPLLAMAESEAELAGVVGHEIGHVQARHAAERIYRERQQKKETTWWSIGGGLLGAGIGLGVGKMVCAKNDSSCLTRAAVIGAGAGVGGVLLIQKYAFMANSREDEMEADRISFRAAVKAGYHPKHVGRFYSKLYQMEKRAKSGQKNAILGSLADAMSTHPPSEERVTQIKSLVAKETRSGQVTSSDFQKILKRAKRYTQERG